MALPVTKIVQDFFWNTLEHTYHTYEKYGIQIFILQKLILVDFSLKYLNEIVVECDFNSEKLYIKP